MWLPAISPYSCNSRNSCPPVRVWQRRRAEDVCHTLAPFTDHASTRPTTTDENHCDRRATLLQIAEDFNAGPSTSVTLRTFQRNIIDMGFRSRRFTRVSLLTARQKALRLAWARQHRHWTVDDWKHVTLSDESRYQLN
ncbi:HTH_Tnp_Tc3_2 domain-containing protein [Trichonephila clavipes]|nr:HTH_Tnp_Tc3_2 domain-containing protein [Trichonephila clavipes]